ncbi:hypothetical protein CRUP_025309 [Coryphaenoides rupestris]|nr:hypothetical protein CRUP_025309 [Coryphaenoides rupestris]
MEFIPRDSLPRVRLMELPYAFQCCVFVSCERRAGGGGGADAVSPWDPEDVVAPRDDPDWEHFLNGLVMLSVFLSPSSWATPPKLLIGWLALVNSLMGVWTGWLAVVDGWTYSTFWRYGAQWECSFLCRFSGFLCVFASQTGLFLLTLAVMERSVMATAPARSAAAPPAPPSPPPPFSLRLAVALCFLLGLAMSMPTLVAGGGTTALCLPLPSSSSSSSSIASSVSLLLLDAGCFLAMTLAYTRLYCRAAHGNKAPVPMPTASSPWEREEEAALSRHVAWLLFSDCLLFLPVAFASSSSLLRLPAGAGPEVLKGVLLLVVPLPACVNPLLYLLFSRAAHQDLQALGKRLRRALGGLRGAPWGRTHVGGRAAGAEAWYDDEDAEKQSCDSTQALVALGSVGGEEEEE